MMVIDDCNDDQDDHGNHGNYDHLATFTNGKTAVCYLTGKLSRMIFQKRTLIDRYRLG